MSHIVVYQGADGSAGYEPCDNLDAAIVAAERMRNVDGVDSPRIFTMEEVEFDFRPYYRVEIPGSDQGDVFDVIEEPEQSAPETQEEEPVVTSGVLTNELDPWGDADATAADTEEPAVTFTEASSSEASEESTGLSFADEAVEAEAPADASSSVPVSEIFNAAPLEADTPPPPAAATDAEEDSDEDAPSMISVRRGLFGR